MNCKQVVSTENRPYWFDIRKEVTEIWDGVLNIKQSIVDTMESFNHDDNDIASRFTGVNLVGIIGYFGLTSLINVVQVKCMKPLICPIIK